MPLIKSAIKRMKQNQAARDRNRHYRSHMKSMIKLVIGYIEKGEMDKANKILPDVIKAIDTAAKKKIVHKNNAARKKSRVQKAINAGPLPTKVGKEKPVKAKVSKKEAKAAKKAEEKAEKAEEKLVEEKKDE